MGIYTIFVNGEINNSSSSLRVRANTSEIKVLDLDSFDGFSEKYLVNFISDPVRFWIEPTLAGEDYITQIRIRYPTTSDVRTKQIQPNSILNSSITSRTLSISTKQFNSNPIEPLISTSSVDSNSVAKSSTAYVDPSVFSSVFSNQQIYKSTSIQLQAFRTVLSDPNIYTISSSGLIAAKKKQDGWKIVAKNDDGVVDASPMLKERSSSAEGNKLKLELFVSKNLKQDWLQLLEQNAGKVSEYYDPKGKSINIDMGVNDSNTFKIFPKELSSPGIGIRDWNVKKYKEKSLGRTSQGYVIDVEFTKKRSTKNPASVDEYSETRDLDSQWKFGINKNEIYTREVDKKYNIVDTRRGLESYLLNIKLDSEQAAIFTQYLEETKGTNFIKNRDGQNYTIDETDLIKNTIHIDPPDDITFDKGSYGVYAWDASISNGSYIIKMNISKIRAGTINLTYPSPLEATTYTFTNALESQLEGTVQERLNIESRPIISLDELDGDDPNGLLIPGTYAGDPVIYNYDVRKPFPDVRYTNRPSFSSSVKQVVSSDSYLFSVDGDNDSTIRIHDGKYNEIDKIDLSDKYIRQIKNNNSKYISVISDSYTTSRLNAKSKYKDDDGNINVGSLEEIFAYTEDIEFIPSEGKIWFNDTSVYNYDTAVNEYGDDVTYLNSDISLRYGITEPSEPYTEFNPNKLYLSNDDLDGTAPGRFDYYISIKEKNAYYYIESNPDKKLIVKFKSTKSHAEDILSNNSSHPLNDSIPADLNKKYYVKEFSSNITEIEESDGELTINGSSSTENIIKTILKNSRNTIYGVNCINNIIKLSSTSINWDINIQDLNEKLGGFIGYDGKLFIITDSTTTLYVCDSEELVSKKIINDVGDIEGSKLYEQNIDFNVKDIYSFYPDSILLIGDYDIRKISSSDSYNEIWNWNTGDFIRSYEFNNEEMYIRNIDEVRKTYLDSSNPVVASTYSISDVNSEKSISIIKQF